MSSRASTATHPFSLSLLVAGGPRRRASSLVAPHYRRYRPRHTTPGRSLHVHVHAAAAGLWSVLVAVVGHLPDLHERVVECGHDERLAHLALHVLDVGAERALRSQGCVGELAALSFSGELLAQGWGRRSQLRWWRKGRTQFDRQGMHMRTIECVGGCGCSMHQRMQTIEEWK